MRGDSDIEPKARIDGLAAGGDFWVFGYGSLIWNPGFAYNERRPALLRGYHRALCVYSYLYRGTREAPGLVMGLDRGGSCRGCGFKVAGRDRDEVIAYLNDREYAGDVYWPRWLTVWLDDGRRVPAYTFVANRDGPQYAGRLPAEAMVEHVARGAGRKGSSLDYLRNLVRHLEGQGIADGPLHRVLRQAEQRARNA